MDGSREKGRGQRTIFHILQAAVETFSESGFDGARMDAIARRAGVNKATIYYHIGDKTALYTAAMHRISGQTYKIIAGKAGELASPEERLAMFVHTFAETVDANPRMGPMMLREVAGGGQRLPGAVIEDIAGIVGLLAQIIDDGHKAGAFRRVPPFMLYMMIVGSVLLYKTSAPVRQRVSEEYGTLVDGQEVVSGTVAQEIARLILNAVSIQPRV